MENNVLDQPAQEGGQYNFDEKVHQLLSTGYDFKLGDYISEGHKVLMKDLGGFIGYLLLVIVIYIVVGIMSYAGQIANFIGQIVNFVIGYSLIMGFAFVARKIFYSKPHQFNNFFDGFKFLGPLVLVRLVITLIVLAIVLPYILIVLWPLFSELIRAWITGNEPDIDTQLILGQMVKLIPLFLLALFGQALFTLAPYIVVFGRKGVWESITISVKLVWKRFLYFILFFIVIGLINIGGAILLLVGLLYTIPLSLCAMYVAYERIVGTNPQDELLDRQ